MIIKQLHNVPKGVSHIYVEFLVDFNFEIYLVVLSQLHLCTLA